jgi:hypothetical protein
MNRSVDVEERSLLSTNPQNRVLTREISNYDPQKVHRRLKNEECEPGVHMLPKIESQRQPKVLTIR